MKGLIVVAVFLAVCGGSILLLRGDAASQTRTLFENLKRGLETSDHRLVVGCLDEGYDCYAQWPILTAIGTPGAKPASAEGEAGAAWRADGREAARTALKQLFLRHMLQKDLEKVFTYTVHSVEPLGDERFEATVTFGLAMTGGPGVGAVDPPIENLVFVLKRSGLLFPRMRILKHDRIRYKRQ